VPRDGDPVDDPQPALYGELAGWWPLISPPEGYAEEAAFVAGLLDELAPGRDVLELGSGGGHNAAHLRDRFTLTLVDRSPDMLAVSEALNPTCEHHRGDMRTVRLGRAFDAVFVHDAIDHLTTVADLEATVETAFVHCRPGGVAVFVPDDTAETFEPSTDHGGSDGADGRSVRYLEWSTDPDPADGEVRVDYVFVLRQPGRPDRIVHDVHRCGLFPRPVWLTTVAAAGFEASSVTELTTEDRRPRELFVGRRPGPGGGGAG
jgi:SAM-dependent methyltransferase